MSCKTKQKMLCCCCAAILLPSQRLIFAGCSRTFFFSERFVGSKELKWQRLAISVWKTEQNCKLNWLYSGMWYHWNYGTTTKLTQISLHIFVILVFILVLYNTRNVIFLMRSDSLIGTLQYILNVVLLWWDILIIYLPNEFGKVLLQLICLVSHFLNCFLNNFCLL